MLHYKSNLEIISTSPELNYAYLIDESYNWITTLHFGLIPLMVRHVYKQTLGCIHPKRVQNPYKCYLFFFSRLMNIAIGILHFEHVFNLKFLLHIVEITTIIIVDHLSYLVIGTMSATLIGRCKQVRSELDMPKVEDLISVYQKFQTSCSWLLFISFSYHTLSIISQAYTLATIITCSPEILIIAALRHLVIALNTVVEIFYYCFCLEKCHGSIKELSAVLR